LVNKHAAQQVLELTPLCGEQDRGDFESWFCAYTRLDLPLRRGSMLAVRRLFAVLKWSKYHQE